MPWSDSSYALYIDGLYFIVITACSVSLDVGLSSHIGANSFLSYG